MSGGSGGCRAFAWRHRHLVYTLVVLAAFLALLDGIVGVLEDRGLLKTYRGIDDMVHFLDEPAFIRVGDSYETSKYGRFSMVPSRFPATTGDAWLAFLLGESFMMGSPYVLQKYDEERAGGIGSWLRADLDALAPGRRIDVINAAAGGQNSDRVRMIAEEVVRYEPDVLVLATCNNEGALPASEVVRDLRRHGAFRLLARLLRPPADGAERSLYTAQDPDTAAVRENFRKNVRAILAAAAARDIPVLVCTLPVNLADESWYVGHPVDFRETMPQEGLADQPKCIVQAVEAIRAERLDDAEKALDGCESVEALRWLGLVQRNRGNYDRARELLEQYTELMPRNRCRPSFNSLLREEAARAPNATLVDLDERARVNAPDGIPGREIFVDYCHLNWSGYAMMADEILRVLQRKGLEPRSVRPPDPRPDREGLRRRFGLPDAKHPETFTDEATESRAPGSSGSCLDAPTPRE